MKESKAYNMIKKFANDNIKTIFNIKIESSAVLILKNSLEYILLIASKHCYEPFRAKLMFVETKFYLHGFIFNTLQSFFSWFIKAYLPV